MVVLVSYAMEEVTVLTSWYQTQVADSLFNAMRAAFRKGALEGQSLIRPLVDVTMTGELSVTSEKGGIAKGMDL